MYAATPRLIATCAQGLRSAEAAAAAAAAGPMPVSRERSTASACMRKSPKFWRMVGTLSSSCTQGTLTEPAAREACSSADAAMPAARHGSAPEKLQLSSLPPNGEQESEDSGTGRPTEPGRTPEAGARAVGPWPAIGTRKLPPSGRLPGPCSPCRLTSPRWGAPPSGRGLGLGLASRRLCGGEAGVERPPSLPPRSPPPVPGRLPPAEAPGPRAFMEPPPEVGGRHAEPPADAGERARCTDMGAAA
mmetsp:Transcript_78322/g.254411  ORF Transcript_78322/g.254411 Transcript_78322/m.254411 type:complete len:246 (+) Transcript_78322:1370-2107(+)